MNLADRGFESGNSIRSPRQLRAPPRSRRLPHIVQRNSGRPASARKPKGPTVTTACLWPGKIGPLPCGPRRTEKGSRFAGPTRIHRGRTHRRRTLRMALAFACPHDRQFLMREFAITESTISLSGKFAIPSVTIAKTPDPKWLTCRSQTAVRSYLLALLDDLRQQPLSFLFHRQDIGPDLCQCA